MSAAEQQHLNNTANTTSGAALEDDALMFFDQVFSLVPEIFKQTPRDFLESNAP
jgi:hypothetical protein